jgi:hypothetical protein
MGITISLGKNISEGEWLNMMEGQNQLSMRTPT